jgi:hypothetical protein
MSPTGERIGLAEVHRLDPRVESNWIHLSGQPMPRDHTAHGRFARRHAMPTRRGPVPGGRRARPPQAELPTSGPPEPVRLTKPRFEGSLDEEAPKFLDLLKRLRRYLSTRTGRCSQLAGESHALV